jgi:hypothetical protein
MDRKWFRSQDDVTGAMRRLRSIEDRRLSIGALLKRIVYLSPLPRYGGVKIVPLCEIGKSRKTTGCGFDP